jgi:flagellin
VLGANDTNTTADHEAINLEAEAIADEFNRLMTTSTYKGRDVFNTTAGSLYVSMGGRDQEMTFGIGEINYGALYGTGANERTIVAATSTLDGPNKDAKFNLAHLPSDAVVAKDMGKAVATGLGNGAALPAAKTYIVTTALDPDATGDNNEEEYGTAGTLAKAMLTDTSAVFRGANSDGVAITTGDMLAGDVLVVSALIATGDMDATVKLKEVVTGENAFVAGQEYVIKTMGSSTGVVDTATATNFDDAAAIGRATNIANGATLTAGTTFTVDADASVAEMAHLNALTQGMTFSRTTDVLTKDIEAIQGLVNTARVQAGSQYAAIESAVNYTTDLTAQYELGYNTVNDVNFSMETAHLAKNQILQQAATAMLAQANQGQQGLLQLIS